MHRRLIISAAVVVLLSAASLPLLQNHYFLKWVPWFSSSLLVADLLVTNATIYTSDASLPFADSMAIRNGRILRVGNYSTVQYLAGHGTEKLNLDGKVVLPGFIDSHVHLLYGGLQMAQVELHGVAEKDGFVKKVKEAVMKSKHGSWILGGGWNNDLWGGELPVASWIDDITPHNPVWLKRMDGHMGLANSLALTIAHISNNSDNPAGGTIVKSSNGEPTGLLIDSAMKLLIPFIPKDSVDERREALVRASKLALAKGVTAVVDMGRYVPGAPVESPWEDFSDIYKWADLSGEMKIRVCLFFPMETWSGLRDLVNKTGRKLSEWIYLGGVKAFVDGSLGSNSALFYEPYADEPDNYGLQVTDPERLLNMSISADESGLQVAIHAIGDKANDLILDVYHLVISEHGVRDRRFRIEHAQHLAPGSAARFGELGIAASVQPDHLLDDADSAVRKLGSERAEKGSYLFQSLLNSNVLLAFGSDWPVTDINPLRSIKTAINRIPPRWENAWISSECMSLTDALNAQTISAARACFLDEHVGSLTPGKLADFVVLSAKSWQEFAAEVASSVEATYVGGVQVYP